MRLRFLRKPLAVLGVLVSPPVFAWSYSVSPPPGITVRSDGGNFSFNLRGEAQVDALQIYGSPSGLIGSGFTGKESNGFHLRRAQATISGLFYSWGFRADESLTSDSPEKGLRHGYITHALFGGRVYIGRDKIWRSMDELASNADTPFLERNIVSGRGLYGARNYAQGIFYRWFDGGFWAGASTFYLSRIGGESVKGTGYNARVAWAPVITPHYWLHFGIDYTKGASGPDPQDDALAGEIAASWRSFYVQGEIAHAEYHLPTEPMSPATAGSLSLNWLVTGETRPYDTAVATYGAIVPHRPGGTWELGVRYDQAYSDQAIDLLGCSQAASSTPDSPDLCQAGNLTFAVNWYPNRRMRLMFNYVHGNTDLGHGGGYQPNAYLARAQVEF